MRKDEAILRSVIQRQLSHLHYPIFLSESMLHEGVDSAMAKDAIQFIVSAGAEYGLGAITLPAAGSGLAVGPTVETMVDSLFAAEEVAGAVEAISNIKSKLGEFGPLWEEAVAAYSGDLGTYYKAMVKIVQHALEILGEKGSEAIEDIASKLQEVIEGLISSLVQSLKAGIKLIIPDATLGLTAAKAFEEGLQSLSENAFDILRSAVTKVGMLQDFISDPMIAVNFFEDVFKQVIDLTLEGAKKLEDISWVKAILAAGPAGGAALKKLGPAGLEKASGLLEEKLPSILKIIDNVLTILVPAAITAVGLFQILMRDDWKKEEQLAASYNIRKSTMKITRRQLRRIIREAIDPREMEEPIGGWVGNALKNDPDYASDNDTDNIPQAVGDLVRTFDFVGDELGGDYEKVVGDSVGQVIEIEDDIDGAQFTVLFPDGSTIMDVAMAFEMAQIP